MRRRRADWTRGRTATSTNSSSRVAERGRVKNPATSPSNTSRDRRRLDSSREPSTKASTRGPGSNPYFFMR
ncbi:hypothetical protein AUQ48_05320 [Kocuria flava]|uniref:Uncharacterized protein n=1 Tax=Kocuria flava TaxID=446860 RepID=A0A2N4T0J5_9MICC|nr:hypothetical protein AUQ48_05320 [Kocuria flava]